MADPADPVLKWLILPLVCFRLFFYLEESTDAVWITLNHLRTRRLEELTERAPVVVGRGCDGDVALGSLPTGRSEVVREGAGGVGRGCDGGGVGAALDFLPRPEVVRGRQWLSRGNVMPWGPSPPAAPRLFGRGRRWLPGGDAAKRRLGCRLGGIPHSPEAFRGRRRCRGCGGGARVGAFGGPH